MGSEMCIRDSSKADNEISNHDLYDIDKTILGNTDMSFFAGTFFQIQVYLKAANKRYNEIYREHTTEYHKQYKEQRKKIEPTNAYS